MTVGACGECSRLTSGRCWRHSVLWAYRDQGQFTGLAASAILVVVRAS